MVLTAAHCVVRDVNKDKELYDFYPPRNMEVNVGDVGDIDSFDEKLNMQKPAVKGYIVHEEYDSVKLVLYRKDVRKFFAYFYPPPPFNIIS